MIRRLDKKTVERILARGEELKQEFINRLRFQDAADFRDILILARRGAKKTKD